MKKVVNINAQLDTGLKAFNESPYPTLGIVTLFIYVGIQILKIICYAIYENKYYNLLIGKLWIHDMHYVASTLHHLLKYECNGLIHYVLIDSNIFEFCKDTSLHHEIIIPLN